MFKVNTFVRFSIALALILVNIYLLSRVSFIFQPLVTMITVITVPMMLSVFFYYLLRPLVNYMEKKKINRTLSILLIYLVIAILGVFFIIGLWPSLREQLINLVDNAPSLINSLSEQIERAWSKMVPFRPCSLRARHLSPRSRSISTKDLTL